MKRRFVILFVFLAFLWVSVAALSESLPCKATTKIGDLNVRKSASTASDRVGKITNKGETVTVLREEINRKGNKWYYVQLKNGSKGYVQAEYIALSTPTASDPSGMPAGTDASILPNGAGSETAEGGMPINFKMTHTGGEDYNLVGDVWSFYFEINGREVSRKNGKYEFIPGEEYEFYCRVREQDSIPDTGVNRVKYVPTYENVRNGFSVVQNVIVEENSGAYRGKKVTWTIEWRIGTAASVTPTASVAPTVSAAPATVKPETTAVPSKPSAEMEPAYGKQPSANPIPTDDSPEWRRKNYAL